MSSKKFYTDVEIKSDIILENKTAGTVPVLDGSKKLVSSAVTSTELGHLSGVTSAIQTQLASNSTGLSDHLADAVDAHDASAISSIAAGNLAATTVQAALDELQTDVDGRILTSDKGIANGVASLDGTGKVPAAQLPSYVDDVLEFANLAAFPATGSTGLIYVALDSNKTYRWSGSAYVEISPSDVNSVFGRVGAVIAVAGDYTASQVTNVPAGTIAAVTVQAAIAELDGDVVAAASAASAAQTTADNHISDATDAHAGTAITNTPSGNLAATTVQAALNELQTDIDTRATSAALSAHTGAASGAHAASAISNAPSGNLVATDVQSALNELQTSIDTFSVGSAGDIVETSFSLANNQAVAANVTGFAFANGVVRSFDALVSIKIDAASDLFETIRLLGVQRGTDWSMAIEGAGDNSLVAFSITTLGQIQYTSGNYTTFVSGAIKFRAITTSI